MPSLKMYVNVQSICPCLYVVLHACVHMCALCVHVTVCACTCMSVTHLACMYMCVHMCTIRVHICTCIPYVKKGFLRTLGEEAKR